MTRAATLAKLHAMEAAAWPGEPSWKLEALSASPGRLFWRRDSGRGLARVKFSDEVQVLEYEPQQDDEGSTLATLTCALHAVLVGIVCVAATVTTFSWLVR